MAKREVVTLNEITPQLEAPQTGDTYYLVRDVDVKTGIFKSEVADGASANAWVMNTANTYATAGANLLQLQNNTTPVFDFSYQGGIDHVNSGASTAAHSQSLNMNWTSAGTGTSSGQYSIVFGSNCKADKVGAFAGGNFATASGNYAFAWGTGGTTASGAGSVAFAASTASGLTAFACAAGVVSGNYSAGFGRGVNVSNRCTIGLGGTAAASTAQSSFSTLYVATTDATQTTLLCEGANFVIPADTTWAFSALVVARSDEADGNLSMVWKLEGCLTRDESNNTALVGSVTTTVIADGAAGAWSCDAVADDTNEALAIRGTGEAATNIRWVAKVDIAQVTFA